MNKNGITIVDEDGKKNFVETVRDFPYNRQTAISYAAQVKTGDVIKKGDLLASSNFTDQNGQATVKVPGDLTYYVTAHLPASNGWIAPDAVAVTPTATTPTAVSTPAPSQTAVWRPAT